jgi:hypothetical protein
MPWKMKKVGNEDVLETGSDGNPVWVDDKGKELAVSGTRIPELNAEAARYRREKEAAADAERKVQINDICVVFP